MGTYLAVGLTMSARMPKAVLEKANVGLDELFENIKTGQYFGPDIYTVHETAWEMELRLKEDVLHEQLIPFLNKLYPALYYGGYETRYPDIMATLDATPPTDWLRVAQEQHFPEFQFSDEGRYIRHRLKRPFEPVLAITCDMIILSLEGKIIMEEYGRQFGFFRDCIRLAFNEFTLADAVGVYITR